MASQNKRGKYMRGSEVIQMICNMSNTDEEQHSDDSDMDRTDKESPSETEDHVSYAETNQSSHEDANQSAESQQQQHQDTSAGLSPCGAKSLRAWAQTQGQGRGRQQVDDHCNKQVSPVCMKAKRGWLWTSEPPPINCRGMEDML